jgi:anionic cell wall polymer biosynthesis LytR-Cps2A-Psr (LCP) family protein
MMITLTETRIKMTIQLKINTNALMTLFPEGSSARLKLQQAVLQEVSKRVLKGVSESEIKETLKSISSSISTEVKKELLATYGKETGYPVSYVELSSGFKTQIKSQVQNEIGNIIDKIIKDDYPVPIESKVTKALNTNIVSKVENAIDKELNALTPKIRSRIKEIVLSQFNP